MAERLAQRRPLVVNAAKRRQLSRQQCMGAVRAAHCADASSLPSLLKAAAMVERGGGLSWQYVAEQRLRRSASTQLLKTRSTLTDAVPVLQILWP